MGEDRRDDCARFVACRGAQLAGDVLEHGEQLIDTQPIDRLILRREHGA